MSKNKQQIVVVLGMHRSGTSAIVRGLLTMGVELGNRLHGPVKGVNDKGFWEDFDIVHFNDEMLGLCNRSWHSLEPLSKTDIDLLCDKGFLLRGIELIRSKLEVHSPFGFKDPRTAKLIQFWGRVFSTGSFDVRYILALRNPLSVVKSLARRDQFDPEKSYMLWVDHIVASLAHTADQSVIAVDYDKLMQDPDGEIHRVASWLDAKVDSEALTLYRSQFLEEGLRHSHFRSDDICADVTAPELAREIQRFLADVVEGRSDICQAAASGQLKQWKNELERLRPILSVPDRQFQRSLDDRQRIANLNQLMIERDEQIANLNQLMIERDEQIANLNQLMIERDEQIANLNQAMTERDGQIAGLEMQLHEIFESNSWLLTKPFRVVRRNVISQPYTQIRKLLSDCAHRAWRDLLMTLRGKQNIRSLSFTSLPYLFKNTKVYHGWNTWKRQREIVAIDQSSNNIPRIVFDSTREEFVAYRHNDTINPMVKVIAFYLPQFHPFPENDQWWGKGFTEWTNVGKAVPNYEGHYQPHCPIHVGYYDLRVPQIMEEHAKLAKEYGVFGFNYYFYWFAGKILMDTPLEMMLQNRNVDMPFCLTWANENWTRRWDGQENDILIAQNHSNEDSLNFIRHLIRYFKDDRYIRIENKPVLMIYRANIIPNMAATAKLWRAEVRKHGIEGLYLICAQTFGVRRPDELGFDASAEFPPHTVRSSDIREQLNLTNPDFRGYIFSYDQVVENAVREIEPDYKLFRTAMLSWDNTARKQDNSHIFHGFSLLRYKQWLSSLCHHVYGNTRYSRDEKIVFVNAWNEWAEGTHLEPDRKYGYGYLQSTYDVLAEFDASHQSNQYARGVVKKNDYAVIIHAHYSEVVPSLVKHLHVLESLGFDLYITSSSADILDKFIECYPGANVRLVENRGRDILPFLNIYRDIIDFGYKAVCKVHTKRSLYRADGDQIRDEQYQALLGGEEIIKRNIELFNNDDAIGMLVPEKYLISHTDHNMTYDHGIVSEMALKLGLKFEYSKFPAGSMFWFRPASLSSLLKLGAHDFSLESGLADGTTAHAVERLFAVAAKSSGFTVLSVGY
ncbi:MAG: glycoside hydrolase family 99-like domain-containing protein [Magnetospirillum sp.]|nr:glycoside hydrolase family 99-like domain-containing protein [Magnetospirillum sp.]